MDREEILRRSRREARDEGMEAAENRGVRAGHTVFYIVAAVLFLVNLRGGRPTPPCWPCFGPSRRRRHILCIAFPGRGSIWWLRPGGHCRPSSSFCGTCPRC